jgi:hypothetical protein
MTLPVTIETNRLGIPRTSGGRITGTGRIKPPEGNHKMPLRAARRFVQITLALGAGTLAGRVSAEVTLGQDPDTGLRSWTWTEQGVSVRLVQRLPDQTRAFFLARGFGSQDADRIARACVFQTIFRNDGQRPVEYDLSDWSIAHQGERLHLRTREVWDPEWASQGIDDSAQTAFRWALLPTVQRFEPGDYNWGMTSFGLPPGEQFDLSLLVSIDGKAVTAEIPSIACAVDH